MTAPAYSAHLAFPFHIAHDGRCATIKNLEDHVRDELIQIILTDPGERWFQPDFGGGARRIVFQNIDDAAGALVKANLTQAINNWLGHRAVLEELKVNVEDATIDIEIKYRVQGSDDRKVIKFQRANV